MIGEDAAGLILTTKGAHHQSVSMAPEFVEGDFVTPKDVDHGLHDRDSPGQRIVDAFTPRRP